jgi:hypothetical protein
MSDLPDKSAPVEETPAQHIAAVQKQKDLYRRITSSMPMLVTVIVHVLLIGAAAVIVVQQSGGAKKKTFEASNQTETSNKQVEHRLQVARRGGASGAAQSPIAANRIFSTAESAIQMPAMSDLPSMGAAGFGGFGSMGSGVGMGAGSGMATSLGSGTGLGGRGFMSLSFLGATTQNASKIMFVVDTSTSIMEPAKGGFRAFTIIREQIMSLVGRLPPTARFNVVLFDGYGETNEVNSNFFARDLLPATNDNKKAFFAWMTPVNSRLGDFGPFSASSSTTVRNKPLPQGSGVDPLLLPPVWSRAMHLALEQQPDTVFVITSSEGAVRKRVNDQTLASRRAEQEKERAKFNAEVTKLGLDPEKVIEAKNRSFQKAWEELQAANRRLMAEGKDPIVVDGSWKLFTPGIQAALGRAGITITQDTTGWSKPDGTPLQFTGFYVSPVESATWNEFITHVARLQKALLPERAALNIFLFVGPDDKAESASANLSSLAKRNGGTFQLLTTKRLEELRLQAEREAER